MSIADKMRSAIDSAGMMTDREMFRTGLTLATVTNIKDEQNLNRVKCLPIGWDETDETDWCYVMAPMGGPECGAFFFPQVNDLVVLAFLDGDPHRPIVLGAYWHSETKPPLTVQDGKSEEYMLKTPKKIEIKLTDTDKKQKVSLTMPSETVLNIDDENSKVEIKDKSGDNSLTMDLKNGEITLKAKTKLTIKAGDTSIVLESGGAVTQKGSGKASIQGSDVEVKANSKASVQGATAEVKASSSLTLNASGQATLKGAMVKIN